MYIGPWQEFAMSKKQTSQARTNASTRSDIVNAIKTSNLDAETAVKVLQALDPILSDRTNNQNEVLSSTSRRPPQHRRRSRNSRNVSMLPPINSFVTNNSSMKSDREFHSIGSPLSVRSTQSEPMRPTPTVILPSIDTVVSPYRPQQQLSAPAFSFSSPNIIPQQQQNHHQPQQNPLQHGQQQQQQQQQPPSSETQPPYNATAAVNLLRLQRNDNARARISNLTGWKVNKSNNGTQEGSDSSQQVAVSSTEMKLQHVNTMKNIYLSKDTGPAPVLIPSLVTASNSNSGISNTAGNRGAHGVLGHEVSLSSSQAHTKKQPTPSHLSPLRTITSNPYSSSSSSSSGGGNNYNNSYGDDDGALDNDSPRVADIDLTAAELVRISKYFKNGISGGGGGSSNNNTSSSGGNAILAPTIQQRSLYEQELQQQQQQQIACGNNYPTSQPSSSSKHGHMPAASMNSGLLQQQYHAPVPQHHIASSRQDARTFDGPNNNNNNSNSMRQLSGSKRPVHFTDEFDNDEASVNSAVGNENNRRGDNDNDTVDDADVVGGEFGMHAQESVSHSPPDNHDNDEQRIDLDSFRAAASYRTEIATTVGSVSKGQSRAGTALDSDLSDLNELYVGGLDGLLKWSSQLDYDDL